MKEEQFIKTNSNTWKELENLSKNVNKKGVKSLKSKEVKKFLYVFRQSSHHLAYARTHYPKSSLVNYLNSLIGKNHNHIYTVQKTTFQEFLAYITYGFPDLLKKYKGFVFSSFGIFFFGFVLSLLLVLYDSELAIIFLPSDMIDNITGGQIGGGEWDYPFMSSYIMTNNISVCLRAFVYGITFGIGTIYVLFFNGTLLGSLTALVYLYSNPTIYWSLILPHGIIELTAIYISGAAGLIIAKNLILPGEYSRKHSLINGAKKSVPLLLGVIIMLIIAGIIEGFYTPLNISESIKLIFAGITGILLIVYFSIPYIIKK